LDNAKVGSPFEQMGGVGVAKSVWVNMAHCHTVIENATNISGAKSIPSPVKK
jgi:hypothetical protein